MELKKDLRKDKECRIGFYYDLEKVEKRTYRKWVFWVLREEVEVT